MTDKMAVNREMFNDVMVPNYNPASMIPVERAPAYGIKTAANM